MIGEPGRRRLVFAAVAGYAVGCAVWSIGGGRFLYFEDLWQLLPLRALQSGLGGALLDLHSQPPFLNTLLGCSLVVAQATGVDATVWLYVVHLLAGGVAVGLLADLACGLVRRPWIRAAVLAVVLLNPYLYASVHFFFYSIWELLFLAATASAFLRCAARPSLRSAFVTLVPAVVLVHTRSLFHPLWLFLLGGIVWAMARSADAPRRRRVLVAVSIAAAAVLPWPAKNVVRFDVPGFSSWAGFNFSRGIPLEEPVVLAAFDRPDRVPAPPESVAAAERAVPPAFRGRPALDLLEKGDGSPNLNHYAMIEASRILGRRALAAFAEEPHLLFLRAADYYANGYTVFEGRNVYSTDWSPEAAAFPRWARAYEIGVFWAFRPYDPRRTRITTGFALLLPILIGVIVVQGRRAFRTGDPSAKPVALLVFFGVWVLLMTLFVDGAEGNRMRFSTQPFWWMLAGWALDRRSNDAAGQGLPSPGHPPAIAPTTR